MDTVLGLSLTSTSIGWVLLDGPGADANTLDHDAFDLSVGSAGDGDISKHTAAVRGAQSIAASSGYQVKSIGMTWTDDADGKATLLLKALPDLGFGNVVSVKLSEATRTWARASGRQLDFEKCAVCVVESTAVTALSYGYDSVRTFTTHMRESADGLSRWLNDIFESNKLQPDALFLVGSRGDVELISGSLSETLPVPVDGSEDAQLALARGAALKVAATTAAASDEETAEKPADHKPTRRWPRLRHPAPVATGTDDIEAWTAALKKPARKATFDHGSTDQHAAVHTADSPSATSTEVVEPKLDVVEPETPVETPTATVETPTAVVETKTEVIDNPVAEVPVIDKQVIDKQVIDVQVDDKPEKNRSWYGPHARAATVLAAGVVAVFVVVPTVTGQKDSTPVENQSASDSTTTSVSVHAVPSPKPVLPPRAAVQPVAAQPAPPPLPPAVVPPPQEVISPATDSGAEQDTVTPIEEPTAAPVTAAPIIAPQVPAAVGEPAAPVNAAPQPLVAPQPPVAPEPLVAPQAHLALPAEAPVPAAAPQPFVAPQAPLAPPAAVAAPPPAAPPAPAPPPPGAPAPAPSPPLPPDPVMQVLSPFFGALP